MPSPESMQSPENEIGEQAAKFWLIMQGLAVKAFTLMREKSESQRIMAEGIAKLKQIAAIEKAATLEREAIWNKAQDPRNTDLERQVREGRQAAGLEPKGVNLNKAPEPLMPVPEVGYDIGPRNHGVEPTFAERVPEPPYIPEPLVQSAQERNFDREANEQTTGAAAQAAALARQQLMQAQALEAQQLEQSRGLGD